MNRTEIEQKNFEILYGGVDLNVRRIIPPSNEGGEPELKSEQIKVKKVGLRDLPALSNAMGDEIAEVAVYIGKPLEFAETILPEDQLEILSRGRALNTKVFIDWCAGQNKRAESMGIDLKALAHQKPDPSGSPNSLSS